MINHSHISHSGSFDSHLVIVLLIATQERRAELDHFIAHGPAPVPMQSTVTGVAVSAAASAATAAAHGRHGGGAGGRKAHMRGQQASGDKAASSQLPPTSTERSGAHVAAAKAESEEGAAADEEGLAKRTEWVSQLLAHSPATDEDEGEAHGEGNTGDKENVDKANRGTGKRTHGPFSEVLKPAPVLTDSDSQGGSVKHVGKRGGATRARAGSSSSTSSGGAGSREGSVSGGSDHAAEATPAVSATAADGAGAFEPQTQSHVVAAADIATILEQLRLSATTQVSPMPVTALLPLDRLPRGATAAAAVVGPGDVLQATAALAAAEEAAHAGHHDGHAQGHALGLGDGANLSASASLAAGASVGAGGDELSEVAANRRTLMGGLAPVFAPGYTGSKEQAIAAVAAMTAASGLGGGLKGAHGHGHGYGHGHGHGFGGGRRHGDGARESYTTTGGDYAEEDGADGGRRRRQQGQRFKGGVQEYGEPAQQARQAASDAARAAELQQQHQQHAQQVFMNAQQRALAASSGSGVNGAGTSLGTGGMAQYPRGPSTQAAAGGSPPPPLQPQPSQQQPSQQQPQQQQQQRMPIYLSSPYQPPQSGYAHGPGGVYGPGAQGHGAHGQFHGGHGGQFAPPQQYMSRGGIYYPPSQAPPPPLTVQQPPQQPPPQQPQHMQQYQYSPQQLQAMAQAQRMHNSPPPHAAHAYAYGGYTSAGVYVPPQHPQHAPPPYQGPYSRPSSGGGGGGRGGRAGSGSESHRPIYLSQPPLPPQQQTPHGAYAYQPPPPPPQHQQQRGGGGGRGGPGPYTSTGPQQYGYPGTGGPYPPPRHGGAAVPLPPGAVYYDNRPPHQQQFPPQDVPYYHPSGLFVPPQIRPQQQQQQPQQPQPQHSGVGGVGGSATAGVAGESPFSSPAHSQSYSQAQSRTGSEGRAQEGRQQRVRARDDLANRKKTNNKAAGAENNSGGGARNNINTAAKKSNNINNNITSSSMSDYGGKRGGHSSLSSSLSDSGHGAVSTSPASTVSRHSDDSNTTAQESTQPGEPLGRRAVTGAAHSGPAAIAAAVAKSTVATTGLTYANVVAGLGKQGNGNHESNKPVSPVAAAFPVKGKKTDGASIKTASPDAKQANVAAISPRAAGADSSNADTEDSADAASAQPNDAQLSIAPLTQAQMLKHALDQRKSDKRRKRKEARQQQLSAGGGGKEDVAEGVISATQHFVRAGDGARSDEKGNDEEQADVESR